MCIAVIPRAVVANAAWPLPGKVDLWKAHTHHPELMSYHRAQNANALADCYKRVIHDSFEAQVPSVWPYSWGGYSYCPPSPPPQD